MPQRRSSSGLLVSSRATSTQPTLPLAGGKYGFTLNHVSAFKDVVSLIYAQVEEIPRETCIMCFRHCVEYLFRYLTFEPL